MELTALIEPMLPRLLAASVQSSLLVALVWALCRALPRLSANAHCWLWWLVALQLVIGLVWSSPVALPLLPAVEQMVGAPAGAMTAPLTDAPPAFAPMPVDTVQTGAAASPAVGEASAPVLSTALASQRHVLSAALASQRRFAPSGACGRPSSVGARPPWQPGQEKNGRSRGGEPNAATRTVLPQRRHGRPDRACT